MEGNLAADAIGFVKGIAPLLLIIGAASLADLTINFVINLMKKARIKGFR